MLREVSDALRCPIHKGRESYVAQDIIDFARSGMAVAELVAEGKKWHNAYVAARHWVRKHRELCPGVVVTRRGEHVYLVKEVAE